jgi:HlyD family secretion protein/macrolide-specific efflux system membrane fusion protein
MNIGIAEDPMKRNRIWPVLFGLVIVAVLIGGGVLWKKRAAQSAVVDPTLIAKVSRGDLEIAVTELGKIEPREKVAVKSKVAGQVEKILVEEGMPVKAGQLLLYLEPIEYQRSIVRADQEVQKAHAALEYAQVLYDRRKRALADRAVAQVDVDLAENDWKTRKIALAQAQEALRVAEDQLRYSKIVSPIDGTVIQRTIRVGETVVPGTMATLDERSLLVVADLSVLVAKADLNQIDVAKAKLGQQVTLTLDALPGKTYKAKVTKIAPASILPKGKDVEVFPVEATLEGAPPEIKPGMTADVKIHVETRKNVLKLPIEAVVKEKGKTFVNKLTYNPPGKGPATTRIEIQPGVRNDRDQEILGGLSEGDAVLIKPPSAEANEFK